MVIIGTILLVRPYRYFQEEIMAEIIKLYERVERRYRPESNRYRAEVAEDENKTLRERIAELERQLDERGPQRYRRRRNNPPQGCCTLSPEFG